MAEKRRCRGRSWNLVEGLPHRSLERLARHSLCAEPEYHLIRAVVGKWLAEQIALDDIASEFAHALEVLGRFDALGGDRHSETLCELDDRLDDRDVLRTRPRLAHEAAVDLELVEHGLVQITDRRVAGAE